MDLIEEVKCAVIKASTTFREDQFKAYQHAIEVEDNEYSSWALDLLIKNAEIAQKNKVPLCDDTGIPHVIVDVGEEAIIPRNFMRDVREGIKMGLRELPGRPMGVKGDDLERIQQSKGLFSDPAKVVAPSFIFDDREADPDKLRIHILMLGGGPEIRASTYRVFHRRDYNETLKEVAARMKTELPKLGCTPCVPAIGVGRTHLEASTLMLKSMVYGNLLVQSEIEKKLTQTINSFHVGALNMGGKVTALGSFVNIGPQRASGVRILCVRPCCCVEPRVASFDYICE